MNQDLLATQSTHSTKSGLSFADWVRMKVRQPTTILCGGLIVGAGVYWVTKSPELAAVATAGVIGSVDDHTRTLLTRIEDLETGVANVHGAAVSASAAANQLVRQNISSLPLQPAAPAANSAMPPKQNEFMRGPR
jgi:hypothetical protein